MNQDSEHERGRQRLRDRIREETGREILAAAEHVFAESGLEAATMAQIAERAGVAVGTLYNRFTDRDALLDALVAERRAEASAKLDERMAELENAGCREQLLEFFATWFEHVEAHRPLFRQLFAKEVGPAVKRTQMSRAMVDRIENILKRGHREKLLRRDTTQSFAVTLFWAAKGMLQREMYELEPLGPRDAARSLVGLFLDGAAKETAK